MFIPLLAGIENGKILIWYAIFAAWGTDIFAYIIGKTFKLGKHKFSKISANKSIEGCIAGVVGAIILSLFLILTKKDVRSDLTCGFSKDNDVILC